MSFMTIQNIGIFVADSEHSGFIGGLSMDLDETNDFELVISTVSNRLSKDGYLYGSAYLHYADAESIRQDISYGGYGIYDLDPQELTEKTFSSFTPSTDPEYVALVNSILVGFHETYGEEFTEDEKAEIQAAVAAAIADKRKQEEANQGIPRGTLVYLRKPDSRPSALTAIAFDPDNHDARKVLPASLVAAKPLGELEIYPTPPSKSKHEPKFWGHFKNIPTTKIYFTGHTQRDVKLKAAIYEAWEIHFEEK